MLILRFHSSQQPQHAATTEVQVSSVTFHDYVEEEAIRRPGPSFLDDEMTGSSSNWTQNRQPTQSGNLLRAIQLCLKRTCCVCPVSIIYTPVEIELLHSSLREPSIKCV